MMLSERLKKLTLQDGERRGAKEPDHLPGKAMG